MAQGSPCDILLSGRSCILLLTQRRQDLTGYGKVKFPSCAWLDEHPPQPTCWSTECSDLNQDKGASKVSAVKSSIPTFRQVDLGRPRVPIYSYSNPHIQQSIETLGEIKPPNVPLFCNPNHDRPRINQPLLGGLSSTYIPWVLGICIKNERKREAERKMVIKGVTRE